jgi:hypothetical protein
MLLQLLVDLPWVRKDFQIALLDLHRQNLSLLLSALFLLFKSPPLPLLLLRSVVLVSLLLVLATKILATATLSICQYEAADHKNRSYCRRSNCTELPKVEIDRICRLR